MRVSRTFITSAVVLATSFLSACIALPVGSRVPTTRPVPPSQTSIPAGSSPVINHDFVKLSRTIPDAALEVATTDGRLLIGRFASADDNGLTLKIDFRLETIKRDDIAHVSGYESRVGPYAFAGASFGLLGGLLVVTNNPPGYGIRVSAMAAGAALGAIGGALTGTQYRHRAVIYARR